MNRYIPLVQLRRSLLLAPLLVLLGGCSSLGVQPWERGTLAKPGMELNSQPLDSALDDQTLFPDVDAFFVRIIRDF